MCKRCHGHVSGHLSVSEGGVRLQRIANSHAVIFVVVIKPLIILIHLIFFLPRLKNREDTTHQRDS